MPGILEAFKIKDGVFSKLSILTLVTPVKGAKGRVTLHQCMEISKLLYDVARRRRFSGLQLYFMAFIIGTRETIDRMAGGFFSLRVI